jgi:hypothetical protein
LTVRFTIGKRTYAGRRSHGWLQFPPAANLQHELVKAGITLQQKPIEPTHGIERFAASAEKLVSDPDDAKIGPHPISDATIGLRYILR